MGSENFDKVLCEFSQLSESEGSMLGKPEISLKGPWPDDSKQGRVKKRCNLKTIRIIVGILASVTIIVGTTLGIIRSIKKPSNDQSCEYPAKSFTV